MRVVLYFPNGPHLPDPVRRQVACTKASDVAKRCCPDKRILVEGVCADRPEGDSGAVHMLMYHSQLPLRVFEDLYRSSGLEVSKALDGQQVCVCSQEGHLAFDSSGRY